MIVMIRQIFRTLLTKINIKNNRAKFRYKHKVHYVQLREICKLLECNIGSP